MFYVCIARYKGNWVISQKHGKGTHDYPSGLRVTGTWAMGTLISGQYTTQEGTYDGDLTTFIHDSEPKRHGTGTFHYNNGEVYKGGWVNDQRHGEGKEHNQDRVYVGTWKDDELEKGTSTDSTHHYNGSFRNYEFHGHGILVEKSQNDDLEFRYEGEWNDGKMNGKGRATNPLSKYSWYEYDGEWTNDKMHGQGHQKFYNKDDKSPEELRSEFILTSEFQGHFVEDERRSGILTTYFHYVCSHYAGDANCSFIKCRKPCPHNACVYAGELKNGLRHGQGKLLGCSEYNGEWVAGERHGRGEETLSSGIKLKTVWEHNQMKSNEEVEVTFRGPNGDLLVSSPTRLLSVPLSSYPSSLSSSSSSPSSSLSSTLSDSSTSGSVSNSLGSEMEIKDSSSSLTTKKRKKQSSKPPRDKVESMCFFVSITLLVRFHHHLISFRGLGGVWKKEEINW